MNPSTAEIRLSFPVNFFLILRAFDFHSSRKHYINDMKISDLNIHFLIIIGKYLKRFT
jgi:hypothetical protein